MNRRGDTELVQNHIFVQAFAVVSPITTAGLTHMLSGGWEHCEEHGCEKASKSEFLSEMPAVAVMVPFDSE